MAGELRAKLVAENRTKFGNKSEALGAGESAIETGINPSAMAKEYVGGKTIEKPLEGVGEKLVETGKYLKRAGTSTMAKNLMSNATEKELAKAGIKSGAQKLAGDAAKVVGGKLIPVVGQYELAATGINALQDAANESAKFQNRIVDASKKSPYRDEAAYYGEPGPGKRALIPESYKLPTLGGAIAHVGEKVWDAYQNPKYNPSEMMNYNKPFPVRKK